MVEVNSGRVRPTALLDLSRVEELRRLAAGERRRLPRRRDDVRADRARADRVPRRSSQAARSVGSPQIRNRATIGGNLATASPAGDGMPVLAVYGADVVARIGSAGTRRMPLGEFLVGPKRTALAPDELIVGVEWRPRSRARLVRQGRDAATRW